MPSFDIPKVNQRIAESIPQLSALLKAVSKMDYTGYSEIPVGALKADVDLNNKLTLKVWNGSSWDNIVKLLHDVETVDGYSAAVTAQGNTIAVRDANGKLKGDILGNANTATTASALSATLPVNKGGTGGVTAAAARQNLDVPSKKDVTDVQLVAEKVFVGATVSTDGTAGRVPAPAKEDKEFFLCADGLWKEVTSAVVIDGMNIAGSPLAAIGKANTYELSAESLLTGESISSFSYGIEGQPKTTVQAVNNKASVNIVVPSNVPPDAPVVIESIAMDSTEQHNKRKAIRTVTAVNAFITAPTITGVADGATDVVLKPTFTVGAFSVTPTGFDAPANLTYGITKQSGDAVESGTRNISASGGTFQPTNNLPLNTALIIKCKWVGGILESPETTVSFTTLNAYIKAPIFTAPATGANVQKSMITAVCNAFSVYPDSVSDTHISTTWRLKKASDNSVLQEAVNSSDLVSHNFTNIAITADTEAYVEAAFTGQSLGSSATTTSGTFTIKNIQHGTILNDASGNPAAIVIGNPDGTPFNIKGKTKWLAVGLASKRSKQKFGTYGWDSPLPNVPNTSYTVTSSSSDSEMNSKYPAEVNDSKHNSDVWMTKEGTTDSEGISGVPAVRFCRSIYVEGKPMDCPNIDCLMRIFKLKDFIDSHDPTAGANSSYKLSNWGFGAAYGAYVWASSEYGSDYVWFVYSDGYVGYTSKYAEYGVVPVQEITA